MGKVIKIGISNNKGDEIFEVNEIEAIKNKGLKNDRHFKEDNSKHCQITLIEVENVNYYNKINKINIPSIKFRRNIITEGFFLL